MFKNEAGEVVFSPTDLVRYMSSPFASWMDCYHLECPGQFKQDAACEEEMPIQNARLAHRPSY